MLLSVDVPWIQFLLILHSQHLYKNMAVWWGKIIQTKGLKNGITIIVKYQRHSYLYSYRFFFEYVFHLYSYLCVLASIHQNQHIYIWYLHVVYFFSVLVIDARKELGTSTLNADFKSRLFASYLEDYIHESLRFS